MILVFNHRPDLNILATFSGVGKVLSVKGLSRVGKLPDRFPSFFALFELKKSIWHEMGLHRIR